MRSPEKKNNKCKLRNRKKENSQIERKEEGHKKQLQKIVMSKRLRAKSNGSRPEGIRIASDQEHR